MVSAESVKARAQQLGFDLCGVAPAGDHPELAFLRQWLDRGFAGRMTSLNRTAAVRADVRRWLPSARSVIVVACSYATAEPDGPTPEDGPRGQVARYARGGDYHEIVGQRLKTMADWLRQEAGPDVSVRWSADTGPVQEKVYARRAGLGWTGKHTLVINPRFGSWIVLGVIATDLAIEPDLPIEDRCGTCRRCLEACPTGAIVEPFVLDARRCLACLTIELRGSIPPDQRADVGRHLFGCDICQEVCPHNAGVALSSRSRWQPRPELEQASLHRLWSAADAELERVIAGTPVSRIGVSGLRRNLAVAIGNSGDPAPLRPSAPADGGSGTHGGAETAAGDPARPSVSDPVVAEHTEWARRRRA
ncbi:MAG TPA: tRNA epoxyqueuosine(34) reductase QueG [Vicinamibacterales bacterium]|nr:tRNA epoxyqueuosine(34) reductase QueG [Vicinamibacterales bacterium]HPW20518.1 tRNA epoxyqueuosine(34) reductase QueG [Vicinamibacterales bacterium]